jgi:hypothetical protein
LQDVRLRGRSSALTPSDRHQMPAKPAHRQAGQCTAGAPLYRFETLSSPGIDHTSGISRLGLVRCAITADTPRPRSPGERPSHLAWSGRGSLRAKGRSPAAACSPGEMQSAGVRSWGLLRRQVRQHRSAAGPKSESSSAAFSLAACSIRFDTEAQEKRPPGSILGGVSYALGGATHHSHDTPRIYA